MNTLTRLTILFLTLAAQSALAERSYHYIIDQQVVPLEILGGHAAFRVAESELPKIDTFVKNNATLVAVDLPLSRARYGIVLIKQANNTKEPAFQDSIKKLHGLLDEGMRIPVFTVNKTMMLPTLSHTVELVDERIRVMGDKNPTQYLRATLDLGPDVTVRRDESRGTRLRFRLRFNLATYGEALDRVNELNMRPGVLAAWPDFIRILPHPIVVDQQPIASGSSAAAPTTDPVSCPETEPTGKPNDPMFEHQWSLDNFGHEDQQTGDCLSDNISGGTCDADIDWLEAWNRAQVADADSVPIVAILDNGVQRHEDIDLVMPGIDVTEPNAPDPNSGTPASADEPHGTHVAGLAGAVVENKTGIAGAALSAKVLPVKIGHKGSGDGWELLPNWAGDGIQKAVQAGARILNNSWFINSSPDPDVVIESVRNLNSKDALFVVAAGNFLSSPPFCFINASNLRECPDHEPLFPGTLAAHHNRCVRDHVITVSGTNRKDEFQAVDLYTDGPPNAPNTSLGSWGSRHGKAISLAAPSDEMCTTTTERVSGNIGVDVSKKYTRYFKGTSAAAPLVSGAAATILHLHPGASAPQLKRWLLTTADGGKGQGLDPVSGRPEPDEWFGHGRVNLDAALVRASVEMNMGVPPLVAPGIALVVERANRRLRFREERHVIVRVMRVDPQGQLAPAVDEPVRITASSGWFGMAPFKILTPGLVRTDCDGIAEVQIRGTSWLFSNAKLTATTGSASDSQRLTVPSLPTWSFLILGALVVISLTRSGRHHAE